MYHIRAEYFLQPLHFFSLLNEMKRFQETCDMKFHENENSNATLSNILPSYECVL